MSQSGLAIKATRADNFYFPPDYEERHGSINKINKAHTLGKRAKYISDGIIIIRFEMPFHVRCDKCLQRTAQGVRFNARKKKVGSYYTTPIYEFTFLCKKCENPFVIRTDPEHAGYSLESGCTKCAMEWDPKSAGTIEVIDPETRRDMDNDPMFKLEKTVTDEGRVRNQKDGLRALLRREDELHGDDYMASRIVRKRFREESKIIEEEKKRRQKKHNFGMILADADEEDTREAARLRRAGMFKTNEHHVNTAINGLRMMMTPTVATTTTTTITIRR
ncbi:Cell cycle control protein cwf16, putative [Perkinsus marinus ATCC 50983]|uniref:Cell cycle control protein cwf16, putative n=1 Tax=Perkinsus marinus (strain ATCC 50983 / TXsc) TaxID=423536 RepID=C5L179_PERM5|nr:Cell cycle control protein cwf16, putative [Perkinsus marinus ATCC 50983]EER09486.1 Cell cycle control protein cwf16, putative [Perkinsus marinus ATCC 50983]|eukprot:XP_002777670.1 Cell cycle control protein cwf16, putative [Perkinsus marinus ATCC 50983]